MNTDPKSHLVVPDGDVQFGESAAKADEVGQSTDPTSGPLVQGNNDDHALMMYLGSKVVDNFHRGNFYQPNEQIAFKIINPRQIADLIPYIVTLENSSRFLNSDVAKIEGLDAQVIRQALERRYGPKIANTGKYEEVGLHGAMILADMLFEVFPEMTVIGEIRDKHFVRRKNPYLCILRAPVENRPFLTGATKAIEHRCAWDWKSESSDVVKPLTFRDILDYARTVNVVPKVARYVMLYRSL